MTLDPRTPVLVGVAQLTRHADAPDTEQGPLEMMVEVARLAADDAGCPPLLGRATSVQAVDVLFTGRFPNPASFVADAIGARGAERLWSTIGGNTPQALVNQAARRIAAGDLDVVVIAGAEATHSRRLARKQGATLHWAQGAEDGDDQRNGTNLPGSHEAELAHHLIAATDIYPVFENALRAASGRSLDEHMRFVGELWSRFSQVAASNPHAWHRAALSPAEIVTPSPGNRMVSFPYTKLLCSNQNVDQAAALILCSAGTADTLGIDRDRWVFPWSGADANDHWFVSERDDLRSSPAIRACGRHALRLAGVGADDVDHVDLYSCFPSAVEIGAAELGLDPLGDRPLTVTGGLVFGGGPGNNYVTHSIAAMAERLRASGGVGLVTANGWYITKHAIGVYGATPPANGFRWESAQADVDATPKRRVAVGYAGSATLESFTVSHGREGAPAKAFAACLLGDGRRAWASSTDAAVMHALESDDVVGRPVTLTADGGIVLG